MEFVILFIVTLLLAGGRFAKEERREKKRSGPVPWLIAGIIFITGTIGALVDGMEEMTTGGAIVPACNAV